MTTKEQDRIEMIHSEDELPISNEIVDKKTSSLKKKKKKREEADCVAKRGICYMSRIPPGMDPFRVRQLLSEYGDINRIYFTPQDQARHKKKSFRHQRFTEGWVEFTKRSVAKKVANFLNGEKIGGKRRSSFYYDIWNIKYLSKFKWDDLTGEIAYKSATRKQKLALEISAAKRERDIYISTVEKSNQVKSKQKRLHKIITQMQKVREGQYMDSEVPVEPQEPKFIRHFPQTRPVVDDSSENKSRLSKELLAGVFGGS